MRNSITYIFIFSILFNPIALFSDDINPVGFIWHYPFVDTQTELISKSGANAQNSRAVWAAIEPEHNKFDFSSIDRQLDIARKANQKLILILEFNPFCRPNWANILAQKSNEMTKDAFGNEGGYPSHKSQIFAELQDNFIKHLVEHLNKADKEHTITHYQAGIEWWHPYNTRYSKQDIAGFREWLSKKYKSIDVLNKSWDSSAVSFDDAPYPVFDAADIWTKNRSGISRLIEYHKNSGQFIVRMNKSMDFQIVPGNKYQFKLGLKTKEIVGRGVYLEVAWHNAKDEIFTSIRSGTYAGTNNWRDIKFICTAPPDAAKASLHIHFEGMGDAWYKEPFFSEAESEKNYSPKLADDSKLSSFWGIDNRTPDIGISTKFSDSIMKINIPLLEIDTGFKNHDAVYYDWFTYWSNESAAYINSLAALVKKYDNTRKLATFLTYSSALPAEWDYISWSGVRLDETAIKSNDIDVLGMQLPIAEGDPYRIAAAIDIARKYEKPMWNLDLMDFVAGIHIGKDAIAKASQTAIQHGATGLIYCNWNGAKDFNFIPDWKIDDVNELLTSSKKSLEIVKGLKPFAEGAIILPFTPSSPLDADGYKNNPMSFIGWYKILEQMNLTVDVVTLLEIENGIDINRYKWILIPDCPFVSNSVLASLSGFISRGGKVISNGNFAKYDEIRNQHIFTPEPSYSISDYGKMYAGILNRDNYAADTPPMMIWGEDTSERKKHLRHAVKTINGIFAAIGIEPQYTVRSNDFDVRSVYMTGNDKHCLYLVNMSKTSAEGVYLDLNESDLSDIKAYADSTSSEASVQKAMNRTSIQLPKFKHSCIVIW